MNSLKKIYSNLILSEKYCKDDFAAKSISLDFLFNIENHCMAVDLLVDCLIEEKILGKLGLNCIYGILQAVKEYKKIYPETTIIRFVEKLIDIINLKIEDTSITNYAICMEQILEFIKEYMNIKLIIPYLELADYLAYGNETDKIRNKVIDKYCDVLDETCRKLSEGDEKFFRYKIMPIQNKLAHKSYQENAVLNRVQSSLEKCLMGNDFPLTIFSNSRDKIEVLTNYITGKKTEINFLDSEEKDIYDKEIDSYTKVLFLIDLQQNNLFKVFYLLGKVEAKLERSRLFVCFCNDNNSEDFLIRKMIDRFSNEETMNKLKKFLV